MEKVLDSLNVKLLMADKHKEVTEEYRKLTTDQERVTYTLKVMLEYNVIPTACGDVKNLKDCEKFREEGNRMFLSKPLDSNACLKAFKFYTKSIAYAPYPSVQLALAYANRSAVLMKMSKYAECIQDIDRALSLDYPDNLRAKVYVRKAECLAALNDHKVDEIIKEARCWLDKMSLDDASKKMLNQRLSAAKLSQSQDVTKNNDNKESNKAYQIPKVQRKNPEVPCAADTVAVKYNEHYGRHVVATRDISPGEVLSVEDPYSLLLIPDKLQTHCSNCLEVCWANIPCEYCTYAMYCSEECKADEWKKYHDIECPLFPTLIKLNFIKLDLLTLRLAIQAIRECNGIQNLQAELKDVDNCDDPRTKGFSKDGTLESNKYRSMYSLVTNTHKRSVPDLFRRSLDASFILYFLATCTTMFSSALDKDLSALAKNADVTFVGGLILRHQQMVPSNIHSFAELHGVDVVERGLAAMAFGSLLNHSCNPNIFRKLVSKYTVIYALYPIKKGEQILDNYSHHYAITPKDVRQGKLLKQYYFECDCVACREDWPLYFNVPSYKRLVKRKEDLEKIKNVLLKFHSYAGNAIAGNISVEPNIVNDLLKIVQVLHDHVPMPCDEMNNVVEMLKHVYDLMGNRFDVPKV